ncbi:MAG: site-2 protease family protein [Gaiellaceae bacterium]
MTANLRVGRIGGIEISLNWSCLVAVVLLVWTLANGIFPQTNPHLSARAHLAMAIVATAGYFLALLLHEHGHALVARRHGMRIDGITLWLFGGLARFRSAFPSAGVEFRVAFAGPLVSALLGVLAVLVARARPPEEVAAVAAWLGYLNLSLFVFNMVPAAPLDGGKVLHAIVWRLKGDEAAASRVSAGGGYVFGYLLGAAGLFLLVFQGSYSGAWLAFLGWFLVEGATAEERHTRILQAVTGLRVRDLMTADPVTVAPELTIARLMGFGPRHTTYPVVDDGRAVGLLVLADATAVPRAEWDERRVRDCMRAESEVPVLAEDDTAEDALVALSASEVGHALVVSNGRLAGLLAASDFEHAVEARLRGAAGASTS